MDALQDLESTIIVKNDLFHDSKAKGQRPKAKGPRASDYKLGTTFHYSYSHNDKAKNFFVIQLTFAEILVPWRILDCEWLYVFLCC